MIVTGPTPPTKPTPPTPPTMNPLNSSTPDSHTSSQVNATPDGQVKPVTPAVGKELNSLVNAFQGNSSTDPSTKKAVPTTDQAPVTTNAAPPASFDKQEETASKTAVPTTIHVVNKTGSTGYVSFLGVAVVVVAVLIGYRLLKSNKTQPRAIIDYSSRNKTVNDENGINILLSPQTTPPKAKSNFELRI
jgi:hypothetical protein